MAKSSESKSFRSHLSKKIPATAADAVPAPPAEPEKVKKVQLGTVITPYARLVMERVWRREGFDSLADFVDRAIIEKAEQYDSHKQPLAKEK